jgi:transcriptional regulator with XRE-family HTH domain
VVRLRPDTDLTSLGAFIKERRRVLRLTQTELAERIGCTQERISLLENGKYGMPSLPGLVTLAHALEVPLDAIVAAAGYAEDTFGPKAPALLLDAPAAPPQSMDDTLVAMRYLSQESSRLALGLEDLQIRLSMTEERLTTVDRLRDDLQRRREAVREQTAALLTTVLSGQPHSASR